MARRTSDGTITGERQPLVLLHYFERNLVQIKADEWVDVLATARCEILGDGMIQRGITDQTPTHLLNTSLAPRSPRRRRTPGAMIYLSFDTSFTLAGAQEPHQGLYSVDQGDEVPLLCTGVGKAWSWGEGFGWSDHPGKRDLLRYWGDWHGVGRGCCWQTGSTIQSANIEDSRAWGLGSGLASDAYGPEGVRVRACENATDAADPHVGRCTRLGTRAGIKQVPDPRGWDPLVGKPASLDGGCGLVGYRDWAERVRGSGRYLGLCRLPPFSLFFYFLFLFLF